MPFARFRDVSFCILFFFSFHAAFVFFFIPAGIERAEVRTRLD